MNPDGLTITLDRWKEVKFKLTDKELTLDEETIITDHITPAAYAIALEMDQFLASLSNQIPWYYDLAATTEFDDVIKPLQILKDNGMPRNDPRVYCAASGPLEAGLMKLFANSQVTGQTSQEVLMQGFLGQRFGVNFFGNSNCNTHTKGTCSTATLAVNGATAKGATTINLNAATVTGTLVPGDSFVIAGDTQRYAVTNTVTASGNAFTGVQFTPKLNSAATNAAVVTVSLANYTENIMYHQNYAALATAPLSEMGNELGAKIASIYDEKNKLAIRSRVYYVGDESAVKIALDVLYGGKILDSNLACLLRK